MRNNQLKPVPWQCEQPRQVDFKVWLTVQCWLSPGHGVLWFSKILSHRHWNLFLNLLFHYQVLGGRSVNRPTQRKEERPRYWQCFWEEDLGEALKARAGVHEDWRDSHNRAGLSGETALQRQTLPLTLSWFCSLIHIHLSPHQQFCPYRLKIF